MKDPASVSRPAFTLRFQHPRTHEALRHAARELGVSMSELAERAIEHELAVIGTELEEKLRRTVELLKGYQGEGVREDVAAFAQAEVQEEDPLRSRAARRASDSLDIGAKFADSLGR